MSRERSPSRACLEGNLPEHVRGSYDLTAYSVSDLFATVVGHAL